MRVTIPLASHGAFEPAGGTRVAVVLPDAELAEACARVLRQEGYAVHTAPHSGHVLLACLEGQKIDVLVAEMSMDEGSGPELARRLRRYNPKLKAILMVRPFTRDDLLKQLERLAEDSGRDVSDPRAYF